MEVINIEAQTFEAMMNRFEAFCDRVESLCGDHRDKNLHRWLDNQDVCRSPMISLGLFRTPIYNSPPASFAKAIIVFANSAFSGRTSLNSKRLPSGCFMISLMVIHSVPIILS